MSASTFQRIEQDLEGKAVELTSPVGEEKAVQLTSSIGDGASTESVYQRPETVLVDVFVAFVVKSFTNLDVARGSFQINYTFVCHIKPPKTMSSAQIQYLSENVKLRLDDQAGEVLSNPVIGEWRYDDVDFIKFSDRKSAEVLVPSEQLKAAVANFPFDAFELHIRFEFESVWIPTMDQSKPLKVRFVVHHPKDINDSFHRGVRVRDAVDRLPEYEIDFANRSCWGGEINKDHSYPMITYKVEVARVSLNVVWTTFFPMFATQALLVLLHTTESNISVGDMATIMLALFAFLTAAREKIPVFPQASVLDKMVFVFVLQTIFVCVDLLYEYFFPENSARDRPIFLIISTVGFGLQILYVAFRWWRSGLTNGKAAAQLQVPIHDPTHDLIYDPAAWKLAESRGDKGLHTNT